MSTVNESSEVVSVPVPKRYLAAVIHALSNAMREEETPTPDGTLAESVDPARRIDWSDMEQCKKLRSELRAVAACTLLDMTAEQPDTWVSFAALTKASGRTNDQARGDLVALTKAIKRIYGISTAHVKKPIEVAWAVGGDYQAYYRMSTSIAKAWKASAKS